MKLELKTPKQRKSFADDLFATPPAEGHIQRGQFRILATRKAMDRVAKRALGMARGAGSGPFRPCDGSKYWSLLYPTPEIAAETIARHLEIQGEYMEETQVKACRGLLYKLERILDEKRQREFAESLPDTLVRAVKAVRDATYKLKWRGGKKWKAECQAAIDEATATLEAEIAKYEDAEKVRRHLYLIA